MIAGQALNFVIANAPGRQKFEVVRDILGQYLSKTYLGSIKGAIANLEYRVANLEQKLVGLRRLLG